MNTQNLKKYFIWVAVLIGIVLSVAIISMAKDSERIGKNGDLKILHGPHSGSDYCLENTGTRDYFIPTKTANEFNKFKDAVKSANGLSGLKEKTCAPPNVSLSVESKQINEWGTLNRTMVTATLSRTYNLPVTVTLKKTGTATETVDYTLPNMITIPASSLTASVTLSAVKDNLDEVEETVVINISSVANAIMLGGQEKIVTIISEDYSVFFNTPGTYIFTVPQGVISIKVTIVGAGGGGAGGGSGSEQKAGAGGGGGAVISETKTVNSNESFSVKVGRGGEGGAGGSNRSGVGGEGGGNSSFTGNLISSVAFGGKGGGGGMSGAINFQNPSGAPGVGGPAGGSGGGAGGNSNSSAGAGGVSASSKGGEAGNSGNTAPFSVTHRGGGAGGNGFGPGAGGGGGVKANSGFSGGFGGNGIDGSVLIEW